MAAWFRTTTVSLDTCASEHAHCIPAITSPRIPSSLPGSPSRVTPCFLDALSQESRCGDFWGNATPELLHTISTRYVLIVCRILGHGPFCRGHGIAEPPSPPRSSSLLDEACAKQCFTVFPSRFLHTIGAVSVPIVCKSSGSQSICGARGIPRTPILANACCMPSGGKMCMRMGPCECAHMSPKGLRRGGQHSIMREGPHRRGRPQNHANIKTSLLRFGPGHRVFSDPLLTLFGTGTFFSLGIRGFEPSPTVTV